MRFSNRFAAACLCAVLSFSLPAFAAFNLDTEIEAAKKLMKSGDFKKSAEIFSQILTQKKDDIKNHPKHPEAWYLFSVSLRRIGRVDLADKALDRAKTLKKLAEEQTGSSKTPAPADQNEEAKTLTEEPKTTEDNTVTAALASATGDPAGMKNNRALELYRQGNAFFDAGQFQAAADAFLLAVEAEPGNIELLERTVICLSNVGSGYYQKTMSVFAALEKADPARMTPSHKNSYARACMFAGKPDLTKAAALLADVIASAPENIEAIILSGLLDSENKQYKQAIEKFEKAIKLDKNAMQAYLGLGEAYQKMQQFAKAIEVLQQARNMWPENFLPLVALGRAYLKNNDYGLALVMFNLAYEMSPDNFDVNLGLLEIFARKGDYRANNHIARCEKFFKGDPRVEFFKATFFELDERLEEAKKIYSLLALYEDETSYRARLRLGQLYGGIGHETFPGALLVAERPRYSRTYSSMQDQELAFFYLSAFLAKNPQAPEAREVKRWLDENEELLLRAREFDALVQSQFKTE